LVARKIAGNEQTPLGDADASRFEREYERLRARLVDEAEASSLPEAPTAEPALKDILRRIRSTAHLRSLEPTS
jgi:hypothetical protein